MIAYVGTYSTRDSQGIYRFRVNPQTGELGDLGVTEAGPNPSFLALDPTGRRLYVVNETAEGAVRAYRVEGDTGDLVLLNQRPTGGAGPCHVSLAPGGRWVFAANFGGGSVAALSVGPDGQLGDGGGCVQHKGPSAPHAHCAVTDPAGGHVYVPDLGLDRILIYRVAAGGLEPAPRPWVQMEKGDGPRHFVFHPDGRHAYVINELSSTICVFGHAGVGDLKLLQRVSTLPEGWSGANTCADIHVSPDGRYLYGSNRGHDSIAIYRVDARSGELAAAGHVGAGGACPRNFAVSRRTVHVANQDSDNVVCFRRDENTGALEPTGHVYRIPAPVCIRFRPDVSPSPSPA